MKQAKPNSQFSKRELQYQGHYGRIKLLVLVCGLFLVGYLTFELIKKTLYSPLAQLTQFEVLGDHLLFTDLNEIEELLIFKKTFMQQNVNEAQQIIMSLPWLKQVEVRKRWPNQLLVKIEEYTVVAYWNQYHLLDSEGISFRVPTDKMLKIHGIVALFGPEGTQQSVLKRYYQIIAMLDSQLDGMMRHNLQINELSLGQNLDWSLKINGTTRVLLWRESTTQRLEALMQLYPLLFHTYGDQLDSIDLRYESGAAVRLKESTKQIN